VLPQKAKYAGRSSKHIRQSVSITTQVFYHSGAEVNYKCGRT